MVMRMLAALTETVLKPEGELYEMCMDALNAFHSAIDAANLTDEHDRGVGHQPLNEQ